MATPVTMPQLGETVVEGTITKWLKKEGETVERDEPLFEISTDKVDTEVPSPMAGKVVEIKVPEGETVSVGTELAMIEPSGDGQAASDGQAVPEAPAEAPAETAGKKEEAAAAPEAEAEAAPISGEAPQAEGEGVEPEAKQPEPAATPAPSADAAPPPTGQADGQAGTPQVQAPTAGGPRSQILSPLVRRLAEENDIDLSRIQGTGTGGRITKKDVQAYLESGRAQPAPAAGQPAAAPAQPAAAPARQVAPPPAAVGGTEEVVPLSRMRQAIAKNMVASIQSTARAWNLIEVNMENVARTREAARESFKQREGIPLTYMPFVARAVCEALLAFPEVNSELREDQLIRKHFVNLGIAVALEDGLIVPVVKGADTMNIVGLARAIQDIATRARSRKLNPDDVHGGTFTITNPGPFGSIISVPIINPPQCAILAFDAVEKRPVVVDDAIAIRHMVYLSMSWDHRIIDGATAARFLARLRQNLETWDFGPEVGLPARQP